MKKKIAKTLISTSALGMMAGMGVNTPVAFAEDDTTVTTTEENSDVVVIQDEVLKQELFKAIQYIKGVTSPPTDADLTKTNLAKVKTVTFSTAFTDTEPLKYLTGVTELTIKDGSNITSLASIENLKNITMLDIRNVPQVTELPNLSQMNNLEYLLIKNSGIQNLGFLNQNTNITGMDLLENKQLSDVSALSNKQQLKRLSITTSQVNDLSTIGELSALTSLTFKGNPSTDISPLIQNPFLNTLNLNGTPVQQLEKLKEMNVKDLTLGNTEIKDLSAIEEMTTLETLELSNMGLTKLPDLSKNTNLTWLGFAENKITDLTPLTKNPNLIEIYFYDNLVEDVTPLTEMPWIEELDISQNLVKNLNGFEKLTNLHWLDAYENLISGDIPENISNLGSWSLSIEFNFLKDDVKYDEQMVLLPNAEDTEEKEVGQSFIAPIEFKTSGTSTYEYDMFKSKFKPEIKLLSGKAEITPLSYDEISVTPLDDKEPIVFEAIVSGDVKNTFTYQVKKQEVVATPTEPETPPVDTGAPEPEKPPVGDNGNTSPVEPTPTEPPVKPEPETPPAVTPDKPTEPSEPTLPPVDPEPGLPPEETPEPPEVTNPPADNPELPPVVVDETEDTTDETTEPEVPTEESKDDVPVPEENVTQPDVTYSEPIKKTPEKEVVNPEERKPLETLPKTGESSPSKMVNGIGVFSILFGSLLLFSKRKKRKN